ncbi:MAG: ECF-type sigma factor [Pirellulales bacterium]
MSDVTRILSQINAGDAAAANDLLPLVYQELRKLAAGRLANERPGQTLQATELVHEAYLRLVDVEVAQRWDSRGHFFAAAAEAMRRILVDIARTKGSQRRRGDRVHCELLDEDVVDFPINERLLDLDDALTQLRLVDPKAAELVILRVFTGLNVDEAAKIQGISTRTAKRNWAYARAWLGRKLADYGEPPTP